MRCRLAVGGMGLAVCLWVGPGVAQESRLPLPADEHRAVLSAAQAAYIDGNHAEAVDRWQSVLDMPEDYFDPSVPGQSVRIRAEESLLLSSGACRELYELRTGAGARALLADAMRDGDDERLKEVVRRYFATVAGHAAATILAERLADEGDVLTAARLYDRLSRHPLTTIAQQQEWLLRSGLCWRLAGFEATALERLDARNRSVANRPAAPDSNPAFPAELQTRLAQQVAAPAAGPAVSLPESAMSRGNPQRHGQFVPAVPVGPVAWQYPVLDGDDTFPFDESRAEEMLTRMRAVYDREAGSNPQRMLMPAATPVTADGLVVFRGPGTIKAISLETGELAWPGVRVDDTFYQLVEREWSRRDEEWHGPNLDLLLAQRMWRDSTASALSTDGRYVYAIADGGMVSSIVQSAVTLPSLSDHPLAPHSNNRLLAFELQTGRFRWQLGGPRSEAPLSGAFFLGAPLPLDGHLYCLVEDQGQVQLVVLECGSREPTIVWSQALYNPMSNLSNPAVGTARRMAGLSPSAIGDVVICPTGETTVVAVDRQRRALLWSYEYQRAISESPQHQLMKRMVMQRQNLRGRIEDQLTDELLKADHWQDSAVVIAGEYVLLTMPDSQDLICLRLLEGTEVWRRPRGSRQFLAAVYDQRVVLVGHDQVDALQIESGESAWTATLPIPGPGGRGFQHGRWYVLPLSTGEAATFDLVTGRETARTPLPMECARGNFVAAQGRIVCQTALGVASFPSLSQLSRQAEEQLTANTNDAAALLRRGQIRLHLGLEEAALADLRQAIAADPQSEARSILAATLIEGLRSDFDRYRGAAAEIEQLSLTAADQARFHRLFAAGLQRRGEVEAAFQQYLKFAENASGFSGPQKVDGSRQVRGDLWIAGRLEELLQFADGDSRTRLQEELSRTVEAALDADDRARLATLLRVIDDPEDARRIQLHLVQADEFPAPQAELVLLKLLDSDDPQQAAEATARLADRWLAAGLQSEVLRRLLSRMAGEFQDVVCLNGRTGSELLAEWRNDPQRAALIDVPPAWPTANLTIEEHARNLPQQLVSVRHLGDMSALLNGWSFYTDAAGGKLVAFDDQGRQKWQMPTTSTGILRGRQGASYVRYVTTYGRYLLLVVEDQWTLVDVIGSAGAPAVLGSKRLFATEDGGAYIPNLPRVNQPGRNRNRVWTDSQGGVTPLGNVGPLAAGMFVYQSGNRLTAINVATGEELWTHDRPDLPPGGDIISDDRCVVVWPPGSTELQVFRAVDGSEIGRRKLPPNVAVPQPEGYWGAALVTLSRAVDGSLTELGLFDPVAQRHLWQRSMTDASDWGVVEGRDFYVLQEDGTLRILDQRTGEDLLALSLPGGTAEAVTVWGDADCWYVATYTTPPEDRIIIETAQPHSHAVHGVVLAASRLTGELEWSVPVQHQQLHRELPGGWPMLVLASQVQISARAEPERKSSRLWSMLLLEKSTGRVLYESSVGGSVERYGWLSEPEEQAIHLAAGAVRVSLKFGEPPADSAQPIQSKPDVPPPPEM